MVALPTFSKLPVIDLGERAGATPLSPGRAGVVGSPLAQVWVMMFLS